MKLYHHILSRRGSVAGFTLIEVVIVIAIISILAGAMAPLISQRIEQARREATKLEMGEVEKALMEYSKDIGAFPADSGDAVASLPVLETDPGGLPEWKGPYIVGKYSTNDFAYDAWNNPYQYAFVSGANTAALSSLGPDRQPGGNDDITLTILMPLKNVQDRIDRTKERLKLIAGDIYGKNPNNGPKSYSIPKAWKKDDWDNKNVYINYNKYSSVVYSFGPDGKNGSVSGDDIYYAMIWTPEEADGGNQSNIVNKISIKNDNKEKKKKKD